MQLFEDDDKIEERINEHIPGKTKITRIQNLADLMWLKKSGYYNKNKNLINAGKRGYATITYLDEYRMYYNIRWTENDAGIFVADEGNSNPMIRLKI